jgi:hypothetical protein
MAALENIDYQKYIQLPTGEVIGIHRVTLLTASDTIAVPPLADPSNAGRSVSQLRQAGDTSVTVSTSGANTITLAGTAGQQAVVVSLHSRFTSHIT